jgi:nitroreductase
MRRLKPDPIPLEMVRKILQTGVQASSGMNAQPWRFISIHSKEKRESFGQRYKAAIDSRFGSLGIAEDDKSPFTRSFRTVEYQASHMHESPFILLVAGKRAWSFKVPETTSFSTVSVDFCPFGHHSSKGSYPLCVPLQNGPPGSKI